MGPDTPHILSRSVMSLGVLIFSRWIPTRAARQRQEARLPLRINWTTAQQVPLPIGEVKFMKAHTPSGAMLEMQVTTLIRLDPDLALIALTPARRGAD